MWDWAVWGALIAGGIAGIGAMTLLALRARTAWRTFKDVRRDAAYGLGELVAKGEATAERATAAGDTAELHASVARLRVSLAQLDVLRAALGEVEEKAGWVTALL